MEHLNGDPAGYDVTAGYKHACSEKVSGKSLLDFVFIPRLQRHIENNDRGVGTENAAQYSGKKIGGNGPMWGCAKLLGCGQQKKHSKLYQYGTTADFEIVDMALCR